MKRRWFRDTYADAVWGPNALRPLEVLVALAYARFAGDRTDPDNDVSWVTWTTLSELTGIRSKDALNRAIHGLVDGGWMVQVEPPRQHYSPRYRLVIPPNPEVRATYRLDPDS